MHVTLRRHFRSNRVRDCVGQSFYGQHVCIYYFSPGFLPLARLAFVWSLCATAFMQMLACMGDARRAGPLSFVGHRYMFRNEHCVLGSQFMGKTCALTISVGGEFHLQ